MDYSQRLERSFYSLSSYELANRILGKILCRKISIIEDGNSNVAVLKGRIVETEMYPGDTDQASHSFNGKKTKRNGAMFMPPGTAYVYSIYGMYFCFNVSSLESGGCVLIRALEPLEGIDTMKKSRGIRRKDGGKNLKLKDLCSGPSKLCQAFDITKSNLNEVDLTVSDEMWIEDTDQTVEKIVTSTRIGIEGSSAESRAKLFRFYEYDNVHVSVRDKERERTTKKMIQLIPNL